MNKGIVILQGKGWDKMHLFLYAFTPECKQKKRIKPKTQKNATKNEDAKKQDVYFQKRRRTS